MTAGEFDVATAIIGARLQLQIVEQRIRAHDLIGALDAVTQAVRWLAYADSLLHRLEDHGEAT